MLRRGGMVAALVLSAFPALAGASRLGHDGPTACTTGAPAFPYHGFCTTYGGYNTYYGSYGPGFPSPLGWVLCADPPNHGSAYPEPSYQYVPTGAPSGFANASALGFALSEAQARGWVTSGLPGQFTADQLGAASTILLRRWGWGVAVPALGPGVQQSYDALFALFENALGATGDVPGSLGLVGGGSSFTTTAQVRVLLRFPGSNKGLVGSSVSLSITGATFDRAGGPTTKQVTTAANGTATVTIVNTVGPAHQVAVTMRSTVGRLGLQFLLPSVASWAQVAAAAARPGNLLQTLYLNTVALEGKVAIEKAVDDPAYYGPAGARFDLVDAGGAVVDSLFTDASGAAGPSAPLPIGTYTVHEAVAPDGYAPAPDQVVTVTTGTTTTVSYTGAQIEQAIRASLGLRKVDEATGAGLGGAVLRLDFDPTASGHFSQLVGTCTTAADGSCTIAGQTSLLPGTYLVTEESPPPGYLLATPDREVVDLAAGETRDVVMRDPKAVATVSVHKYNADSPGIGIPGAVYDLYAVDPGPQGGPDGPVPPDAEVVPGLSWWDRGTTDAAGQLAFSVPAGYSWCVLEHEVPPGFTPDPARHCTAILGHQAAQVLAIAEHPRTAELTVAKYNADHPGTVVPGATYDVFVVLPYPAYYPTPVAPSGVTVPAGQGYWTTGTTGVEGSFVVVVPAGHRWCILERTVPPGYLPDHALHCTAVLNGPGTSPAATLAVAEIPVLPYTGLAATWAGPLGLACVLAGLGLVRWGRRAARPRS